MPGTWDATPPPLVRTSIGHNRVSRRGTATIDSRTQRQDPGNSKSTVDEIHRRFDADLEREDSPRPLVVHLDLVRSVGFERVDVLHERACFPASGAVTPTAT